MPKGYRITDQQLDTAIELHKAGYPNHLVAECAGMSPHTLSEWIVDGGKDLDSCRVTRRAAFRKRWDAEYLASMQKCAQTLNDHAEVDPSIAFRKLQAAANGWGGPKLEIEAHVTVTQADLDWADDQISQIQKRLNGNGSGTLLQ